MMRTLDARSFSLLGALLAGAAVTLAVMAAAGAEPAVWVAVAGAAACACGLVVGATARVLPAAVLAGVASAALVLSVGVGERETAAEVRAYAAPAVVEEEPRAQAEEPAPPPPVTRAQFVRRFYSVLSAGRFGQAWGRLGPAVQARSPSFEAWKAGYATTVSQRVESLQVEADGNVRHVLVTVDRTPCGGTTEQRYEMLWYLQREGRTFTARDVVGVQLAGVAPALACG
jgi:pyruvate/2-oxoglutarate dehydrogenase complex dihydrolipoamide acyltransferase (E2) component